MEYKEWKWQGEDYRGDWGWQILVDGDGRGIIVGQDNDGGPCKYLKAGQPVEPELCITGLLAGNKPRVNAVHVFSEANARLIVSAVNACIKLNPANPMAVAESIAELYEACRAIINWYEGKTTDRGEATRCINKINMAIAKVQS